MIDVKLGEITDERLVIAPHSYLHDGDGALQYVFKEKDGKWTADIIADCISPTMARFLEAAVSK